MVRIDDNVKTLCANFLNKAFENDLKNIVEVNLENAASSTK